MTPMTKTDVINYYGSVAKVAKAVGQTRQGVYIWSEELPIERQCLIERLTNGKLKADQKRLRELQNASAA